MDARLLTERLTLQAKAVTRDALGGEVLTWSDQATVWARVEAITGREVHAAQQLQAEVTLRAQIRARPDLAISAEWRALWNGDVLAIHAVLPSPRRDMLTLLCSQGIRDV
jgi:SPP1 family predicted phage head-tail adaptor